MSPLAYDVVHILSLTMAGHVRELVKQIDGDTWLVGDKFILH